MNLLVECRVEWMRWAVYGYSQQGEREDVVEVEGGEKSKKKQWVEPSPMLDFD